MGEPTLRIHTRDGGVVSVPASAFPSSLRVDIHDLVADILKARAGEQAFVHVVVDGTEHVLFGSEIVRLACEGGLSLNRDSEPPPEPRADPDL
jgi:hypothetical protein